jgi:tetratricopeptide (TPR) repeat protein
MAKAFLCKVAVAQISANPAYADELVTMIQEPVFPSDHKVGLFRVAGIEQVNALRQEISEKYVAHLNRKLDAIVKFAARKNVDLLIFPEYSVPPESLLLLRQLSDDLGVVIVAGSHVVTLNPAAQDTYRSLGLSIATRSVLTEQVRRAACIVFIPTEKPIAFMKYVRSKWESQLIKGDSPLHIFPFRCGHGNVEAQVLICVEAIAQLPTAKEKHTHARIVVVPAFTPSCDPFYDFGRLCLANGKCTLFANIAEFGGSKIFARAERANLWFSKDNGSSEIPRGAEALLVVEADLEKQFDIRKSAVEHTAVNDIRLYPLIYPLDSEETAAYEKELTVANSHGHTGDLSSRVASFCSLSAKVFSPLLQDKLRHFVAQVLPNASMTAEDTRAWMDAIIISDTTSTSAFRWDMCSHALETINQLMLSGALVGKTEELIDVYKYLMGRRNELAGVIKPRESRSLTSQKQLDLLSGVSKDVPFIDRQGAFDRIRRFMADTQEKAFAISGMRGIGKSSLVNEAFRQAIPPRRRIWLQVTEGMSHLRLLAELGYSLNLRIPDDLNLATPELEYELERKVMDALLQGPPAAIVFDEVQYLLGSNGEFENPAMRELFSNLLISSSRNRAKYFLISHIAPKLPADFQSYCSFYHLQGLENKDTERLLFYWFQFQREMEFGGHLPTPSEAALSILSGHPLATKVAARLWSEHPSEDIAKNISIFKELRDTIVPFILEQISLSEAETDLLIFASVLRLPASRDLFIEWRGDEVNYLLNSLASQYLIESTDKGYQLHPLVRDYYYQRVSTADATSFHRIAGKFYFELFERARLQEKQIVPEYLGEACHHYLAAGDSAKVKSVGFYRQELRPVALSHYRRREYKMALKDYLVLVSLDDGDDDAHFHLAMIYAREKNWPEAELHFGRAIELRPRGYWIYQGFGSSKLTAGNLAEAEELLKKAEELNPYNSLTLVDIGRLKEREGDTANAEEYYRSAIEYDPNNSFAYYSLASLLYREGETAGAYDMAMAALATKPLDERNKRLLQDIKRKLESK